VSVVVSFVWRNNVQRKQRNLSVVILVAVGFCAFVGLLGGSAQNTQPRPPEANLKGWGAIAPNEMKWVKASDGHRETAIVFGNRLNAELYGLLVK
jgi:hypothetical protein